jgi:hypothetical protein
MTEQLAHIPGVDGPIDDGSDEDELDDEQIEQGVGDDDE